MPYPLGVNGLLDVIEVDDDVNAVFHCSIKIKGWFLKIKVYRLKSFLGFLEFLELLDG